MFLALVQSRVNRVHLHRQRPERRRAPVRDAERAKPVDDGEASFDRRRLGAGEVGPLSIDPKGEAQVAPVSNRDRLPSARLSDDQEIRRRMGHEQVACPARIMLFSDSAHDDDLAWPSMAAGGDKGGRKRTLRITGPTAVQPAAFEMNGQCSVDRVDVAEEEDGRRPPANLGNRVSGGVRTWIQTQAASQLKEPVHSGSFLSGRTVFFEKGEEDFDVIHGTTSSRGRPGRTTIDPPG